MVSLHRMLVCKSMTEGNFWLTKILKEVIKFVTTRALSKYYDNFSEKIR